MQKYLMSCVEVLSNYYSRAHLELSFKLIMFPVLKVWKQYSNVGWPPNAILFAWFGLTYDWCYIYFCLNYWLIVDTWCMGL